MKFDHELQAEVKSWLRANARNYDLRYDLKAKLEEIAVDALDEYAEEVGPCRHSDPRCGCPDWMEREHPVGGFVS